MTRGTDPVEIHGMRRRHLDGVVAVENLSNPHPWSKRLFENELSQPTSRSLVAIRRAAEVVGFGCLMIIDHDAHVTSLGVAPARRRHGIGSLLLGRLLDDAVAEGVTAATLEVRRSNAAALALYEASGFVMEGERLRYYSDNAEDAVIMWCRDLALRCGSDGS